MKKEEIIAKLKGIVKPYVQDEQAFEDLTEETDFIKDLKINSANLVDVILDVEDQFDVIIDNDSMEEMLSVKAAIAVVERKLAEKA
ncbi:MAG: acyl carrier protein [Flavobacteriales bacterium]|nr:acyl carrier protein [Flavobacteriales bacterium]